MDAHLECIPCIARQTLEVARELFNGQKEQEFILRKSMEKLLDLEWNMTSPEIVNKVHGLIRKLSNNEDPYKELKIMNNEQAKLLAEPLKVKIRQIEDNDEKLRKAILLALAGNIIDIGPSKDFNMSNTIDSFINRDIQYTDYEELKKFIYSADTLLYFADNAGEIVFDKILLEIMNEVRKEPFKSITFVIKGGPIVNDATEEDVRDLGIDKIPNLKLKKIGNGEEGTGPARNSEEVKSWIEKSDLIISKGQANFEGLNNFNNIFFLLIAKCNLIASLFGVKVNTVMIKYNYDLGEISAIS